MHLNTFLAARLSPASACACICFEKTRLAFDMQAGIASSPPSAPPRATGRSILQIGSRLRAVRFAPGEHRSTSLLGSAHSFEPFFLACRTLFGGAAECASRQKLGKTAPFLVQSLPVLFVRSCTCYDGTTDRCPSQRKEGSKNTDRAIHDIRDERMIAVQKVATSTKPKMQ